MRAAQSSSNDDNMLIFEEDGNWFVGSTLTIDIFRDGAERYGPRAWSDDIIRRLEDATGISVTADGFPAELVDHEPEVRGHEVVRTRS